jgi:hypothetical protein
MFQEDSVRISRQCSQIPCICPDDMVFHPDTHQSSNIRPDNVIYRPDDENLPSGLSSVSRSFELLQLASIQTFQHHVQMKLGVRPAMGFLSKTQIWEDHCNRPEDVDSRKDALIHKASRAFKIQTSGLQSSWSMISIEYCTFKPLNLYILIP